MENLRQEILAFFGNSKNRTLIYFLFGGIGLLAISSAVLLILSVPKTPTLTKDQEKVVIDEIVKNNPSNILDETINNNSNTYVPPETPSLGTPSQTPDLTKYNYRKSIYTYSKGPAYKVCDLGGEGGGGPGINLITYLDGEYTYTSTEYFETNRSLRKALITGTKSDLFSFSLSEYSNVKSESYEYAGGDYAIKAVYEAYPGYTQSEYIDNPVSYVNQFTDQSEYKFLGEETINGRATYKIQSDFYAFCNGGYYGGNITQDSQDPNVVNYISIYYADKITYSILKSELYLNEVSSNNLISRTESDIKTALVKSTDVASEFKFNYQTAVKTLDYTGYWNIYNNAFITNSAKTYLSTTNIDLLSEPSYILGDISVPNSYPKLPNSDYMSDRNFYPTSVEGDEFYDHITSFTYIQPEVTSYLYRRVGYNDYTSMYIRTYSSNITPQSVILELDNNNAYSKTSEATTININGANIPATKFTIKYKSYGFPVSYSTMPSYPVSYPIYEWDDVNYVFIYQNKVYKLSGITDLSNLNFKSYKTNISSELNEYFDLEYGYDSYFPTSYSSYPVSYNYGYY